MTIRAGATIDRRVLSFSVKAASTDSTTGLHTFEGLAAVWDLDLGNDIIHKGAFKDTIKEWKASDDAMPLLNSHDQWTIMSALGQLIEAKETTDGLWTKWELIEGPEGDAVMRRLTPSKITNRPIVGKLSIGFEPLEFSFEQPKDAKSPWDRIRHLTKVALHEVSLVLFPMAPGASIDASTVKNFIRSTHDTDPAKLSKETKAELRKLASRIGLLLQKKQDPIPDDSADHTSLEDENESPLTPPNPDSGTPPGTDTDTDDDEADDSTDGQEDDDELDDVLIDEDAEDQSQKSGDGVYIFQEALAQRLARLDLQRRMSDHREQHA